MKIKTVEGLGIEYDENVVCDVCRSVSILVHHTHGSLHRHAASLTVPLHFQPDSEDGNEMVFCDNCDICVHQVQ